MQVGLICGLKRLRRTPSGEDVSARVLGDGGIGQAFLWEQVGLE